MKSRTPVTLLCAAIFALLLAGCTKSPFEGDITPESRQISGRVKLESVK